MQKKTIIAALAAAALTMGFSACNGNDEPDKGDYKLTVNVHADAMGSDGMEFATIYNAYRSAFGLGEMTDEATESVEITGKDSLACVSAIQKKCAQAEAVLQGETWSDANVIAIRDANTNAEIYSKQYGAPAENGYESAKFNQSQGLWTFIKDVPSLNYVETIHIDSRSTTIWPSSDLWTCYYVGKDLNYKAGGNYVYPSFTARPLYNTEEVPEEWVGGLLVLNNESGANPPEEFSFEGVKYHLVKDANTGRYAFDLNHKAGGNYLYLYWADSKETLYLLDAQLTEIYWADHDISGEKYNLRVPYNRFVRGVTLYKDGNLVLTHPNGIDLNLNAGGKYMYWREVYRRFDK